jgi:hypothetical protein
MSLKDEYIKQELETMASRFGPSFMKPATVLSINTDDTIQVQDDTDLVITDVRLKSVVKDGNKIIMVPTVGSTVQIAPIDNSHYYIVVAIEDLSRMYIKVGLMEFEVKEKVLIGNGTDTLKTILTDIVNAVQQIVVMYGNNPDYDKLTAAIVKINNLLA